MSSSESEVEDNLSETEQQSEEEENVETNGENGETPADGDDNDKVVTWSDLVCNFLAFFGRAFHFTRRNFPKIILFFNFCPYRVWWSL